MWNPVYIDDISKALEFLKRELSEYKTMSELYDIYDVLQEYIDFRKSFTMITKAQLELIVRETRMEYLNLYSKALTKFYNFCKIHAGYLKEINFHLTPMFKNYRDELDANLIDDLNRLYFNHDNDEV